MCTIAIKTRGYELSEDIIKNIFNNNTDGAGFMWVEDGKVRWKKGFFSVDALLSSWRNHVKIDTLAALHCRIATHGAKDYKHCHPFPLTEDNRVMFKRKGSANAVLMHNGVMTFMETDPNYNPKIDSDSSAYARKMYRSFGKVERLPNETESIAFRKETESSNRLVVFCGDGTYWTSGEWQYKDGILYSNGNWKYSYAKYYNYYENSTSNYRNNYSSWNNWKKYDNAGYSKSKLDIKCVYATGKSVIGTAKDLDLLELPEDYELYVAYCGREIKMSEYMKQNYAFYIDLDGNGKVYQKVGNNTFIECPDMYYDNHVEHESVYSNLYWD